MIWVAQLRTIDASDERLKGAILVASVSGGKDSAAMSLALTAAGLEHRRVFANTGWENEQTLDYLRGELTKKLGPIDWVEGRDGGMANMIRRKGAFPSRISRFCTQELKVKPIQDYVTALQAEGHDVVNVVGIRNGESVARSKMEEWEWSDAFDCWVWRPIITWSEQDVIDAHRDSGLMPNPLYLAGADRVGCWPCIFARKREIRMVAEMTPERIDEIRDLETYVDGAYMARLERKGKTLDDLAPRKDGTRIERGPTFFRSQGTVNMPPIDDVVEWSKTSRGGKQIQLLDSEPAGCVRWGLCEQSNGEKDDE